MSRVAQIRKVLAPGALAFAIALAIASVILLLSGHSPPSAYRAMWGSVNDLNGIVTVLNFSARYYVVALAVAIGFQMNLFNIGANGQLLLSALVAGAAGAAVDLPAVLHVPFVLIVAMLTGAVWGAVPAVMKTARGVNEVVATIMLNFVATAIIAFSLQSSWTKIRDPGEQLISQTRPLDPSAQLPALNRVLSWVGIDLTGGTRLGSFLVIAVLVGLVFNIVIYRSRFGYDLRASGINPSAAQTSGVDAKRMVVVTMIISGALAGLAGMSILMGEQYSYGDRFPQQLGFTAIGIALLGRNHPAGVAVAAVVWSTVEQGARGLATVQIPNEIGQIVLGVLLFVAVIVYEVYRRRAEAAAIKDAAARAQAKHSSPPQAGPAPAAGVAG
jgi:simple sugar transport system permease protein